MAWKNISESMSHRILRYKTLFPEKKVMDYLSKRGLEIKIIFGGDENLDNLILLHDGHLPGPYRADTINK